MTYAHITAVNRQNKTNNSNRKRITTKAGVKEIVFKSTANLIVVLVFLCLLFVIYLVHINDTNDYSYAINSLEEEQIQLQAEYQALSIEAIKLESNQRATSNTTSGQYQLPDTIYFD